VRAYTNKALALLGVRGFECYFPPYGMIDRSWNNATNVGTGDCNSETLIGILVVGSRCLKIIAKHLEGGN
jgi:hypothetical protein